MEGLDDWAAPDGIIREAEERAATAYGLDEAHFLTGGTSQGLTTAILSVLGPGEDVVLHRGVHRSVLHGLVMTGALAHFVPDVWNGSFGVTYPDVPALARAVRQMKPKAAVVTYPTYEGLAPDLEALARACRESRSILIVDAAHGAHFGHGPLPPLASVFRPDLVVYGMHKSGGALTPASLLGRIGDRVDPSRLAAARHLVGTSSPSYPIMASIDSAVINLTRRGDDLLEKTARALKLLRGPAVYNPPPSVPSDPTRRVLAPRLGGAPTAHILRRFGVVPEYVSESHALLYAPMGCRPVPRDVVAAVLAGTPPEGLDKAPDFGALRMSFREAYFHPKIWVPLAASLGRVAGAVIVPSPPGVPLIWPGEVFSSGTIRWIERATRGTGSLLGLRHGGEVAVLDE